jgi:hypothetical protein
MLVKPKKRKVTDRRTRDGFIFVERRKGKIWMYCQVVLCIALTGYLVWLVR